MSDMSTPTNPFPGQEQFPPEEVPSQQPIKVTLAEVQIWSIGDVLLLAGLTFAVIVVMQVIAFAIGSHYYPKLSIQDLAKSPKIILPPQAGAYVFVFLYMVGLLRSRGIPFWRGIQWRWPATWFLYLVGGFVLSIVIRLVSAVLPIPKELPIEQYFTDVVAAYLLAVFGITLAPLMEELFFRGFLYHALERRIGVAASVFVTSLLFAFIHASQLASSWGPLLLIFLVGVTLTLVRVRTGSVASSFLLHAGYNFSLFATLFFGTGHFRHLENMR
jgi:hypothetical protein